MFSLQALSEKLEAYRSGDLNLYQFENWFRSNSWGWYSKPGDVVSDAIARVEGLLTSYDLEEIDEPELQQELAVATRPFAPFEKSYVAAVRSALEPTLVRFLVQAISMAADRVWRTSSPERSAVSRLD